MSLTQTDMDYLVRLVDSEPRSKGDAAELLGKDRGFLNRLFERVNDVVGDEDLRWNEGHRLVFPAEVRRLAATIRRNDEAIVEATRFPRVSAGSLSAMLVRQVLAKLERPPRAALLRSSAALDSLRSGEIDLAVVHSGSTVTTDNTLKVASLCPWQAVIVGPRDADPATLSTISWDLRSFGADLNRRVGEVDTNAIEPEGPLGTSYLSALEMIRRGLPYRLVLPNIDLSAFDRQHLLVIAPESAIADELVAVYRREDEPRLSAVLDPALWREAAYS